jgi:uncharacterized membrane protein YbaN (DUF454 family)
MFRKVILISAGSLSVALGFIGIFVPLLPTTPFLLLAAACYVRSSKRLYSWLLNNRWLGNYIKFYREYRAITLQAKILTLIFLWSVISYTTLVIVDELWIRILLGTVAVSVSFHLLYLKTLTPELRVKIESLAEKYQQKNY